MVKTTTAHPDRPIEHSATACKLARERGARLPKRRLADGLAGRGPLPGKPSYAGTRALQEQRADRV